MISKTNQSPKIDNFKPTITGVKMFFKKKNQIKVQDKLINISQILEEDYICLTDMVKGEEGVGHIKNWMRNRNTVEFLGLWEVMNNENFKGVEFDTFRN